MLNYSLQIISAVVITNQPVIYYFLSLIIRSYETAEPGPGPHQTQAQLTRFRFSLTLQERLKKERHELKNIYYTSRPCSSRESTPNSAPIWTRSPVRTWPPRIRSRRATP